MLYFILISCFVLLLSWRILHINSVVSNWNERLRIYISYSERNERTPKSSTKYLKSKFLKPGKYYLKMSVWEIEDMVSDKILIFDVNYYIK